MMKLLILISILTFPIFAQAEQYSMRRCMILPITDTAGNSFGFSVYEQLERNLKEAGWCEYQSSSSVINIFSKYRDRLNEYLQDTNVLKTVADRLKVGTLIRISLVYDVDKVKLNMDIIGENGVDVYLSEKAVLNGPDQNQVMTTIQNWLEIYETSIPYDGKVLGVLGEQVTFTNPGRKRLGVGQEFKIKRLMSKKKHPLLKKIVEWDSTVLAKGKVFNVSRNQALGKIKIYSGNKKAKAGDWVRLEKYDPKKYAADNDISKYTENQFGKVGDLTLAMTLSSHTSSSNSANGNIKLGGFTYGISAEVEAWVTRNYFVLGEFSRSVGNLSKQSGSPSSSTSSLGSGVLKLGGGFKYLPMGFFYGPQVNIYGGWVNYSYTLDKSAVDGFGESSLSGLFVGLGGSIPLQKGIRVFGSGEIVPFGEFKDSDSVFGSNKSISSMSFQIGGKYQWSPTLRLMGAFKVLSNSAKFSGVNSEAGFSDTQFKLGGVFAF